MISIETHDNKFEVRSPYNPSLVRTLKTIDGRRWNPENRTWEYPASPAAAYALDRVLREAWNYVGDDEFNESLNQHLAGMESIRATEHPDYETCTPCWDHQKLGLDLIIKRKYVMLAWDMGVGKTKSAIDAMGILKMQRVLIVCPKSVITEWPRQFKIHGSGYNIKPIPLQKGSVKKRLQAAIDAIKAGPCALIINYEGLWRAPFGPWVLEQLWDMVVLDEIHKIKENRTKVGKFSNKLRDCATRRIGLSGTPIPNTPLDLWSQCRFLDPGLFGESFVAFRSRYAILGGWEHKQVVAFKHLDELNERFYSIAHRITKAEALDLPDTMDEERIVELGSCAARIYDEVESSFVARVEEGDITVTNALTELLRLQQITGGAAKFDDRAGTVTIDTAKADALSDILDGLPKNEPVVVFCRFHHDLDVTHAVAEKLDRTCLELSGRIKQLEEWRETGGVFAVQIASGGLGVDLSQSCYCVYYSLGFSLAEYDQSRARLHRKGQTRAVTYYHLLAESDGHRTIDHKVYKALSTKRKVVQEVLREIREITKSP